MQLRVFPSWSPMKMAGELVRFSGVYRVGGRKVECGYVGVEWLIGVGVATKYTILNLRHQILFWRQSPAASPTWMYTTTTSP